ncbi:hypothetical protein [Aurantimonas coralicida]|uniref:hypothetical protein n=1 Tax=Aurantimonas coralicida TaxID=182270 RepID=UPI001D190E0F|nr:hypothetical protein [Aurantimonas coralicida]MCC4298298.1 hypothetical protein [Aurantimonas coralicida]
MPGDEAQLEERKFDLDAEIRRREMTLKEAEAQKGGISAAQATIAGAVLAFLGGAIGAIIATNSDQKIEERKSVTSLEIEEVKVRGTLSLEEAKQKSLESLEKKKFETSLIFEAIKTPTRADAIRNLKFFVSAGFISDPDGKIAALDDGSLPSLSEPSPEAAARALSSTGVVTVVSEGDRITCTGTAISARKVVTASACVNLPSLPTSPSLEGAPCLAVPNIGAPDVPCIGAGPVSSNRLEENDEITFQSGDKIFALKFIELIDRNKLATLEVISGDQVDEFLDKSLVRTPMSGEQVYLAISLMGKRAIELRTCQIVQLLDSGTFEHDCETGAGAAGAVVIAVSDNALLGIHHSRSPDGSVGIASILPGFI